MASGIAKLLTLGSEPIIERPPLLSSQCLRLAGSLAPGLLGLLGNKNGFYAFEAALHVFPAAASGTAMDIEQWNSPSVWRSAYGDLTENCLFFAEDVFGGQFCIRDELVYAFDPETGNKTIIAKSLEDWAGLILRDYEVQTGFSLAHRWQAVYGALPEGNRLVPKVPFTCGGQFSIENLYLMDAVRGMILRGELATQIRNLPEGASIQFKIID